MNYLSVLKHINLTLRYDTTFMDDYDCHMLKKAVKRCVKESVNRKHPITVSILYNCFRLFTSCPLHLCMKALFLVAFFSLLRKSNLVPLTRAQVSSSSGCFLRRRDLLFTPDGAVLRVFKTKTLQFNERVLEIPLPHIPNSIFCPVQALKEYLAVTHVDPDMPLFCLPSGGHMCPIYAHYLTSFLKHIFKCLRLDPRLYSVHSFRRGGATFLFQSGAAPAFIKFQGDWKSDAYLVYLSLSLTQSTKLLNRTTTQLINIL